MSCLAERKLSKYQKKLSMTNNSRDINIYNKKITYYTNMIGGDLENVKQDTLEKINTAQGYLDGITPGEADVDIGFLENLTNNIGNISEINKQNVLIAQKYHAGMNEILKRVHEKWATWKPLDLSEIKNKLSEFKPDEVAIGTYFETPKNVYYTILYKLLAIVGAKLNDDKLEKIRKAKEYLETEATAKNSKGDEVKFIPKNILKGLKLGISFTAEGDREDKPTAKTIETIYPFGTSRENSVERFIKDVDPIIALLEKDVDVDVRDTKDYQDLENIINAMKETTGEGDGDEDGGDDLTGGLNIDSIPEPLKIH